MIQQRHYQEKLADRKPQSWPREVYLSNFINPFNLSYTSSIDGIYGQNIKGINTIATMKLLLFGTLGCHLCEDAEVIIAAIAGSQLDIECVDIAEHEQWQENYAIRIPVLYHPETKKELSWPFSQAQVEMFINGINND